ncbi:flagellar assembly protein FliX [Salinarimonas sp.]|uniref:flagellar assembly protein FliX n=1 Tax=Salinarimonas sp. TaxID=2766526 RepID=UPI00391D5C6B
MRIESRPGAGPSSTSRTRGTSGNTRFSVAEEARSEATARPAASAPTASLDAILALQGEPDLGERRRRASARGRALLDGLDRLKAGLLAGRVSQSELAALEARLVEARERSGDPRLDGILDEIELRARVEIAKLAQRDELAQRNAAPR